MEHSLSDRRGLRWTHRAIAMGLLGLVAGACQAQATAPRTDAAATDRNSAEYALTHPLYQADSLRVVGNYYPFDPAKSTLSPLLSGFLGGFRASTGVVGLARPVSLFDVQRDEGASLPYVGLGYSRGWFTGQLSLNADFGLASQPTLAGGGRLRSLFGSSQSLDDVAGDPRWAPVMAVNLRYSF